MSFGSLLAFFLIQHIRRILRMFAPHPKWEKVLLYAVYAIIFLFILEVSLHIDYITKWIWHLLLLFIILITFKRTELFPARTAMYAVLPLILLSIISDIVEAVNRSFYTRIENYINFTYGFAITWMIVLLFVSRKQQKALAEERRIRQQEEERNKIMAAQKAELEIMVAERTSELTHQKEELLHALTDLKSTQSQLIQKEKMASLGELTAGIAHEIQNPLNFVNNFSEVNIELANEIQEEMKKMKGAAAENENLSHLVNDLIQNQQKIMYHGKRADAIVKGMLQHSRKSTGQKEPTDINALVDEYLRLSYHGLRAKDKSFNANIKTSFDTSIDKIGAVPQDIGRVLLNLFSNAFYSVQKKKERLNGAYEPTVFAGTVKQKNTICITIRDNGTGIPQNVMEKIFQPFFTTKPTGQGTGLGLSLSYDIIKAHGGEIKVETKEGEYAEFIIQLPYAIAEPKAVI